MSHFLAPQIARLLLESQNPALLRYDQIYYSSWEVEASTLHDKLIEIASADRQGDRRLSATPVVSGQRLRFLAEYLIASGFKTGLVVHEKPYLSQSFLKDYSRFYAESFAPYQKYCSRVHVFANCCDAEFEEWIQSETPESLNNLQERYLGYTVLKPLVNSLLGPTVLNLIGGSDLICNCGHSYPVNIQGRKLTVFSFAYQQQDTTVGACASVSIWCALGQLSRVSQTAWLSVPEITEATGLGHHVGRKMPNNGLNVDQTIKAISAVGLVCEILVKTKELDNKLFQLIMVYG